MFNRNDKNEKLKKIRRERHKELKRIKREKQKEIDDENIKNYNKLLNKAELIGRRRNESDENLMIRSEEYEKSHVLESLLGKFMILIVVTGAVTSFIENNIEVTIYILIFLVVLFFYFLSFKKYPYGKNEKRMFNLVEIKHIITVRIVLIMTIISPLLFMFYVPLYQDNYFGIFVVGSVTGLPFGFILGHILRKVLGAVFLDIRLIIPFIIYIILAIYLLKI